jgi:hypothetical protein
MRGRQHRSYSGPYLKQVAAALDVPVEWLAWNNEGVPASKGDGDVVGELSAVVARLVAKKVMSRNEVIALTGLLRIRENEA